MWKVEHTAIEGLLVLTPTVFEDARGHFLETFNDRTFKADRKSVV